MRHSLATFLAEQGTDSKVIQRMLRWSSTRMFQRYFTPRSQEAGAKGTGSVFRQDGQAGDKRGYKEKARQAEAHKLWSTNRNDFEPTRRTPNAAN